MILFALKNGSTIFIITSAYEGLPFRSSDKIYLMSRLILCPSASNGMKSVVNTVSLDSLELNFQHYWLILKRGVPAVYLWATLLITALCVLAETYL